MVKTAIPFIMLSILVLLFTGSCTKKEKYQSPTTLITSGTWKLSQFATDDNHNHKVDPNELKDATPGQTLLFNKDMSGVQSILTGGKTTNYNYTWALFSDQALQINLEGHDTTIYSVLTLTGSTLTLMDSIKVDTTFVDNWYYYKK